MLQHFRVRILILTLSLFSQLVQANESETRSLEPFESIFSTTSMDIVLIQGDHFSARIDAENIHLEDIVTEVKNGRLTISLRKNYFWNVLAKIVITFPTLKSLHMSGTGNFISQSMIQSDELNIQLNSAGNIQLNLILVDKLTVRLYGTGDMQIGGSADDLDIRLSGSGDIEAFGLKTIRSKVEIQGSGNVRILVLEALDATVSGSGTISYKGKPLKARTSSSGPGGIIAIR